MSGSSVCHHPDLHYHLNHVAMADTNVHSLEISAKCNVCDSPMVFLGQMPSGISFREPTVSPDGIELRLPMIGADEEPDSQVHAIIRMHSQ